MKKIIRLVLCMTIWPAIVSADTATNMQVQRYLNALGYDVGAIDGIVGKNTKAQLNKALVDSGYAFDGAVDDEEINILKAIAKKKRIKLPERMIGVTRKNLEQIMDKKTARLFVASDSNTDRADAFEIVQFKGKTAARMSVSLSDRGHVDDWGRFGEAGAAQRFQIQEKPKISEMRDGREYWYKFSLYIPKGTGGKKHMTSFFDFKDRKDGWQSDQSFGFMDATGGDLIAGLKQMGEECQRITNSNGRSSDFCESPQLVAIFKNKSQYYGKWLDFVFQINMKKGEEIVRFWINGKLTGVSKSDLSLSGNMVGFKFGPYRNFFRRTQSGITYAKAQDETVYYADIMRRNSCEELQLPNCAELRGAQTQNGVYGASEVIRCFREPQQGKPCPVICRGRECEKLGG